MKFNKIIELIPVIMFLAAVALVVITIITGDAEGEELYPADLWKGLLGEAIGEGRAGMTAVCHVYKNRINRGMSLGCVALKRKDLDKFIAEQAAYGKRIGRDYKKEAKNIVNSVFAGEIKDPTGGATHYENIEAFPVPPWAPSMKITAKIKSHTFYREK